MVVSSIGFRGLVVDEDDDDAGRLREAGSRVIGLMVGILRWNMVDREVFFVRLMVVSLVGIVS
jgi:hypothetical protein